MSKEGGIKGSQIAAQKRFIDMTGKQCGRLLVVKFLGTQRRRSVWECQCECGNTAAVDGGKLRSGHTQSCGCLQKDTASVVNGTHRKSKSKEYRIWQAILRRCGNKNSTCYDRYGGRGIKVCERWLNSFENFLADMGVRPSAQHSVERNDNNGHYEPGNCRWATRKEQGRNTRTNRVIEWNGEKKCLAEWAEIVGIPRDVLKCRLKRGWSTDRMLTEQVRIVPKPQRRDHG